MSFIIFYKKFEKIIINNYRRKSIFKPLKKTIMKTFKTISVGDIVYYIKLDELSFYDKKNKYGDVEKNTIINSFVVKRIFLEDGNVLLSAVYGSIDLRIPKKKLKESIVSSVSRTFFLDEDEYKKIVRHQIVLEINMQEESIVKYKQNVEEKIKELQKKYWNYLQ